MFGIRIPLKFGVIFRPISNRYLGKKNLGMNRNDKIPVEMNVVCVMGFFMGK